MVQSIKTEVIYYGMPSDFEFEFNLCGCCQMRLLKETADDNAALLKALQKGISRSRVIIIVGKVIGDTNIISLVSKAIGYGCETLDTEVFDVKSDEPITLIKNSVPLITKDGTFGGCIIESGPQSMIFLSDDKKVRKEIMNSLVHSYISDLSRFPVQLQSSTEAEEITMSVDEMPADNIPSDEEAVLENEEITEAEIANAETDVDAEAEVVPTVPMEFEDFSTFSENAEQDEKEDPYNINNLPTTEDIDIEFDEQEETDENEDEFYLPKEEHNTAKGINIATLVLSVILLILLAFIVYSFIYLPLSNGISVAENFSNLFSFLKG